MKLGLQKRQHTQQHEHHQNEHQHSTPNEAVRNPLKKRPHSELHVTKGDGDQNQQQAKKQVRWLATEDREASHERTFNDSRMISPSSAVAEGTGQDIASVPLKKKNEMPGAASTKGQQAPNKQERPCGVSHQKRYEPKEPLSPDRLKAWRREQRKLRNRESAAASRQRVRDLISSLQNQVTHWKDKYEDVMRQIHEIEAKNKQRKEQEKQKQKDNPL